MKATFEGDQLRTVKVRRFTPEYELSFEYSFDENGKVNGIYGAVTRWGKWVYEAEHFRSTVTGLAATDAHYTRIAGGLSIPEPLDGSHYASFLTKAPAIGTPSDIPCAKEMIAPAKLASLALSAAVGR